MIALITDNSGKWVKKTLDRILEYRYSQDFLIIDNMSKDDTVPIIVGTIGQDFIDEKKYKFYINTNKKTKEEINEMVSKIARNEKCVIIDSSINKKDLYKRVKGELL